MMTADAKAVLSRRYDATPAEVFAACTQPHLLARWLGPKAFDAFNLVADLRVGGRFAFRMTGAGGVLGARGTYQEIEPDERIVLTWQWLEGTQDNPPDGVVSLLTIEIAADGEGTKLTLTHAGLPDREQADGHAQGWEEALSKLEHLLARP